MVDKANWVKFFEETFLIANINLEVVLGMLFFTLSGADVDFSVWRLRWRTYTTKEVISTTRRIELVGKKEFPVVALDAEHEIYVIHVVFLGFTPLSSLGSTTLDVYPFRRPQIFGLIAEEALTKVSAKYSDFADVFSPDLASKLLEHTGINNHAIKLVASQQPPYRPIYSQGPVELETLNAYIETNLANKFIRPSKFPTAAPILFDQKSDGFLRLYVNYQDLNNLTIKNWYPLLLIGELLDKLERAKQFIQLDLTSAYHQMMPFGLTNVPASFQGYINKIFAEKLDIFVIVYLDDIFIWTNDDVNGHVAAVHWVLEQLRKFLLFAKMKKCQFHQEEVWFLGYMLSLKGVRIEDKRIEAVKQ